MKRVFLTGPVIKVLATFGSIVGVGLIIYLMSGMPAPREADRVASAHGEISIIKPRDWGHNVVYAPAGAQNSVVIICEPLRAIGVGPRLLAGQLRTPPSMDQLKALGMQPGEFQGRDAMIHAMRIKRDFLWRAVFEREGNWYEVVLRLDGPQNVPGSSWWPYLESFRAGKPSTRPASP